MRVRIRVFIKENELDNKMVKANVEVTDTFGGESNYSWVRRYSFLLTANMTDRQIVTRAKKAAGWTGLRCRKESWGGDMITLRPLGVCQVMFITFSEGEK